MSEDIFQMALCRDFSALTAYQLADALLEHNYCDVAFSNRLAVNRYGHDYQSDMMMSLKLLMIRYNHYITPLGK